MTSDRRLSAILLLAAVILPGAALLADTPTTVPVYTDCPPSADGIGKVYMGREIANVMGHLAAWWLDRPTREQEEQPQKVIDAMQLKGDEVVADIGAGTGYFSFRIAPLLPKGKVLAEDIQPQMLTIIRKRSKEKGIENVEPVLGTVTDPKLPVSGVDVVLFVDSYHEFDHPREMMDAILTSLKPGGRVVDVEYKGEDPTIQILPHHKMTEAQATKEMSAVGLKHVKTVDDLPQQHVMIFEKEESGTKAE
jgi:ubiquinone/menaquinone biosynthesis C-methylase UbiE